MIDFDEIRKEVAIRHNVLIGKDDPVLVTVTLNEMILEKYLTLVENQYAVKCQELTVILQQQIEQSRQTAGKIITEASNYVSDQVHNSVESTLKEATVEFKKDIQAAIVFQKNLLATAARVNSDKESARIASITAAVSSLIAVGAVIFAALQ